MLLHRCTDPFDSKDCPPPLTFLLPILGNSPLLTDPMWLLQKINKI